jgi:hypothetical protein
MASVGPAKTIALDETSVICARPCQSRPEASSGCGTRDSKNRSRKSKSSTIKNGTNTPQTPRRMPLEFAVASSHADEEIELLERDLFFLEAVASRSPLRRSSLNSFGEGGGGAVTREGSALVGYRIDADRSRSKSPLSVLHRQQQRDVITEYRDYGDGDGDGDGGIDQHMLMRPSLISRTSDHQRLVQVDTTCDENEGVFNRLPMLGRRRRLVGESTTKTAQSGHQGGGGRDSSSDIGLSHQRAPSPSQEEYGRGDSAEGAGAGVSGFAMETKESESVSRPVTPSRRPRMKSNDQIRSLLARRRTQSSGSVGGSIGRGEGGGDGSGEDFSPVLRDPEEEEDGEDGRGMERDRHPLTLSSLTLDLNNYHDGEEEEESEEEGEGRSVIVARDFFDLSQY